ncbi:MAG: DUF4184 family protein [Aeromicrobium sp.]
MPFTLSHPAAVLPLRRLGLPTAVLVIASMVPDIPVFLGWTRAYELTHSLVGIVTIDLALAVAAVTWWSFVMRDALVDLAPSPVRSRLAARVRPTRRDWALTPLAAVLGAMTHLAWDSFTHSGQWGVGRIDWLQAQHGALTGFKWAQYASGVVGLAIVVVAAGAHLRTLTVPTDARRPRVLPAATLACVVAAGVVTALAAAVRSLSSGLPAMAFHAAVDSLIVVGLGLFLVTAAWRVVESRHDRHRPDRSHRSRRRRRRSPAR